MIAITIKSDNKKAIKAIKSLAEELQMEVSENKSSIEDESKYYYQNGARIKKGNKNISIKDLEGIWTGRDIDARKLREKVWNRQHE